MPKLEDIIKQMALNAMDASDPAKVMYGNVVAVQPLQIRIDQKIVLTEDFLVLSRSVTNYTVKADVNWNKDMPHSHELSGQYEITINNGLAVGDTVILLRVQGGQKYVVLDKVGGL